MGMTFTIKRGDTLPVMRCSLLQDAAALDLTGATAAAVFFSSATGVLERVAAIDPVPSSGVVTYTFVDTDWDTGQLAVGSYKIEIQVTFSGGEILTIPTSGYGKLVVKPDLAD